MTLGAVRVTAETAGVAVSHEPKAFGRDTLDGDVFAANVGALLHAGRQRLEGVLLAAVEHSAAAEKLCRIADILLVKSSADLGGKIGRLLVHRVVSSAVTVAADWHQPI